MCDAEKIKEPEEEFIAHENFSCVDCKYAIYTYPIWTFVFFEYD